MLFSLGFLFLLIPELVLSQGQITLSGQPDVTSNVNFCPNTTVEFTCVATEVAVLMWQRNGNEIFTFTPSSPIGCPENVPAPFTACLTINTGSTSNNYRSTLTVQSITDLESGDVIGCLDDEASLQTINVSYALIDTPSSPAPNLTVTSNPDETASITLTFDQMDFVDEYRVAASGDERVNCPSACSPNSTTCVCTGFVPGDDVMVTLAITAVNCDTQEGPAYNVTITPRVPAAPSSCWILPVFSGTEMGPRTGIVASWRNVLNPRNLSNKLSQDVLNYTVSIVEDVIGVPVNIACTINSTCWTNLSSYYNEASNYSSSQVRVAATNIFGNGPSQDCQLPLNRNISPTNTLFNVDVIESGRTVQCNVLDEGLDNFVCHFCYGLDDCEGPLTCVNVTTTSQLRDVNDGTTYCYRVIGLQDGVPVALIQDTFTLFSVPSPSWITPLYSISIILCITHCIVLIIAVIIAIWLKFRPSQPPDNSQCHIESDSECKKLICLVVFACVLGAPLLVSIILLIAYGATSIGSTVAAAFVFSVIALIPTVIIVVINVLVARSQYKKYNVSESDDEEEQPHLSDPADKPIKLKPDED